MEARSVEAVVAALEQAGVRYLIAGGLAVVAHGYLRLTKDIDLVLKLEPDNARRALAALERLGYRPSVPVAMQDFLDAAKRREWIEQKRATVFPLYSDEHRMTPIELFLEEPFDFARAETDALDQAVKPGVTARFVGLADLLAMKRAAGRLQDLADIEQLELLTRDRSERSD